MVDQSIPHAVEYYYNESLTKRVPVNETGNAIIDWGETVPGLKKEKILYIKNLLRDKIILRQPHSTDEDLHIVDFPTKLLGLESGMIKLVFSPPANRLRPLNGDWGFEDLVIG